MAKYVVRYGSTRMVGVFFTRQESHRRGARVVARTPRGLELADVLCEATEHAVAQLTDPPGGQILREMLPEDYSEAERIELVRKEDFGICERQIAELGLPMQLVDVERLFGGERVVVYYLSEDRVDFRALVKALQGALKTRVEMRQIGVRDEAKLLADYGDCGKPVCCNTHLIDMPPVSMKMAKMQKATLDPTKISGRCGRLKCCLRYEYDTYEELQKTLPPIGSDIITTTGRARVLNHEILSQQLLVQTEDNRRLMIPAADVLTVLHVGSGQIDRGHGDRGHGDRGQGDRGHGDRGQGDRGPSDRGPGERGPGERGQGGRGQGDRPRGERGRSDRGRGDQGRDGGSPADRESSEQATGESRSVEEPVGRSSTSQEAAPPRPADSGRVEQPAADPTALAPPPEAPLSSRPDRGPAADARGGRPRGNTRGSYGGREHRRPDERRPDERRPDERRPDGQQPDGQQPDERRFDDRRERRGGERPSSQGHGHRPTESRPTNQPGESGGADTAPPAGSP